MKLGVKNFEREIDTIQRFVPPESKCDELLLAAVRASHKFRRLPLCKRPRLMSSLLAARDAAQEPLTRREIAALIQRLTE